MGDIAYNFYNIRHLLHLEVFLYFFYHNDTVRIVVIVTFKKNPLEVYPNSEQRTSVLMLLLGKQRVGRPVVHFYDF